PTAATLFVVASIGMAVGGGLYLPAVFATLIIFLALEVLGWMEARLNLKPLLTSYEVVGATAEAVLGAVNEVLDERRKIMQNVQLGRSDGSYRVVFSVEGTMKEQRDIYVRLRQAPAFQRVSQVGEAEEQE